MWWLSEMSQCARWCDGSLRCLNALGYVSHSLTAGYPVRLGNLKMSSNTMLVKDDDLFQINITNKEAICKKCGKKITDLRKFSYQRHYKLVHRSLAIQLGILQDDDSQFPLKKVPKIDVRMNQETYMESMVELVTVNGLPLNVFRYILLYSV